jgi:hypothetical protein
MRPVRLLPTRREQLRAPNRRLQPRSAATSAVPSSSVAHRPCRPPVGPSTASRTRRGPSRCRAAVGVSKTVSKGEHPAGIAKSRQRETGRFQRVSQWARLGSNQRPPACEAGALPLSYAPGEVEDTATCSGLGAGAAVMRISANAPTAPTNTVMQPVSSAAFKPVE